MKSFLPALPVCLLAALILPSCSSSSSGPHDPVSTGYTRNDVAPVKSVLESANAAIGDYEASHRAKKEPLHLKSALFTFKTVEKAGAEVGFNILVLNLGAGAAQEKTHEVRYSYKRPTVSAKIAQAALKSDLAKAIDQAFRQELAKMGSLVLDEITVTVTFGVERKISVGGQLQFSIVAFGPKFSASGNNVQTITLVFGR